MAASRPLPGPFTYTSTRRIPSFWACRAASCAESCAAYGVPFLDFNDELALTGDDFYDYSHVRPRGRTLWQERLALELARLYETGAIEGAPEQGDEPTQ